MKKILPLLFIPLSLLAQTKRSVEIQPVKLGDLQVANEARVPYKDGKIFYELIDSSIKKSKTAIYESAKLWFGDIFRNSKYVLQVEDKEAGNLSGKGTFDFDVTDAGITIKDWCQFTLKITCRNNKFRIQLYDVMIRVDGYENWHSFESYKTDHTEMIYENIVNHVNSELLDLINNAKKYINKKDDF